MLTNVLITHYKLTIALVWKERDNITATTLFSKNYSLCIHVLPSFSSCGCE